MKRSPLLHSAAIVAALFALSATVWQLTSGAPGARQVLSVGVYENSPKIYTAEGGRPAGLFIELLEAMASVDGWQPNYVHCVWADCLAQLEQGKLDLLPGVAFSDEREKRFDFHRVSVASNWSQVYARPELKVLTLADLSGKRVAIMESGVQQPFFAQLMASGHYDYRPLPLPTLDAAFAAVQSGAADAVVSNSFFAARNAGKYGVQETPIIFLPANLYFASANGRHADLLQRIDEHLTAWRSDPDSLYFDALHRAMVAPPEVLVPHWVKWLLAALAATLALLVALSLLLRRQVEQRTRALAQTARELEEQRATLEQLVLERTAELAAAKDEAERLSRIKSDFLANMSHEIRTPMNAILGMLYLALKGELSPGLRNRLSKAQGAAQSLLGIINDILDFSKIEAGKLAIEEVEFGLDAVLEQLSDAIGNQIEQKGLEFLIRYDPTIPPRLLGDPLRLGQILLNLCGNSLKFTDRGEIELSFRRLDSGDGDLYVQVCVRDSGIGFSPEVQASLFCKFTQADQSTTRRFGGTGLGLAISKNLVEMMGGRIWVEDSQQDQGTTICFTLRLKIARESPQNGRIEQVGSLLQGIRVLVVDDNEVSREILCEMLRVFHIDVGVAGSGPAALAALVAAQSPHAAPYDLVLMDWRMPGMNGDEAIQRIHREAAIVCQPKVVMVTAYGREDVLRLAERAGVDGFLIKPVSPSTLLDTILSVLGRKRIFDSEAATCVSTPALAGSGGLAGARVLLVDDNDINREFASELLRSEGIVVDEAENGELAVDRVRQNDYDAVLMDIQMPVLDGLDAARRIRALGEVADSPARERFARLPIIAMTALAMTQDAEKSQAAGMNDHVTKPVAPEQLMATLAKWVHVPPGRGGTLPAAASMSALAAADVTPTSEITHIPPELLAMTGVVAREGVRRIGGKAAAYRKQLRRFRERYPDAIAELRRLIAEKGTQRAEEFCHALKGVTGNLAAHTLYARVSAIDALLKHGSLPAADVLDEADALLQQLLREIDGLPVSVEPAALATGAPLAADDLRVLLASLEQALDCDLGAAEPLLAKLRAGVAGTPLAGDVAAVAELADLFDIDGAVALLKKLEASLTETMP